MAFVRQELEHSDQNLNQIGGGSTDATDQGGDKRTAIPAATRATPTASAVTTVTTSGAGVVAAGSGGRAAQGSFATKKSAAHWRKIRSAVSALAAFRRRKVRDYSRETGAANAIKQCGGMCRCTDYTPRCCGVLLLLTLIFKNENILIIVIC